MNVSGTVPSSDAPATVDGGGVGGVEAGGPERDADLRERIRRELHAIRPGKLPEHWSDDATFRDDLELDSLDFIEMVARLEQATGVFVPDEHMSRLTSVATTVAYVRQRATTDGRA